ncbi:endoplasmic reticulum lectin 1 isoform X2 [Adelges cooleyi]|uniref:endoplasmic reticulum lectin 1 isoform X2 n=1 Tax=Adelges cooleyi TaxID=133065 RepID=UPI002180619A|nr:endoplasmic reticulum lectin 1 isoform X2 [Adelges cooleyi]
MRFIMFSFNSIKLILLLLVTFCLSQEFKGFDDTILYKIRWPGKELDGLATGQEENTLKVKTALGESYQCILPQQDEESKESKSPYSGPSPLELLAPLFSKQACSYRVDTYWIYEVCHGRHVRQYHSDREEKSKKEQEYFLGKWTIFDGLKLEEDLKRLANLNYPGPTQTRKVEGVNLPFFQINMTDGTVCDLSGRPRHTNVLYVCYPQSKHNLFSVKETSTCQYEVIVLTSLLCSHPWYKPPNSDELNIDCLPIEDSPRKPHNLKVIEADAHRTRKRLRLRTDPLKKMDNVIVAVTIDKNGEQIRVKLQQVSPENSAKERVTMKESVTSDRKATNEINEFLNGELCLDGGSGWWKYEICHKKYVQQVHKEKGKPDIIINLGEFDLEEHIEWLERNPEKKVISGNVKNYVSHYYSRGSVCESTGERRETEVRFKCVNKRKLENQVAMYLMEPKTCKYILTVESLAICDFLVHADENGMLRPLDKNEIEDNITTLNKKENNDGIKLVVHKKKDEVESPTTENNESKDANQKQNLNKKPKTEL